MLKKLLLTTLVASSFALTANVSATVHQISDPDDEGTGPGTFYCTFIPTEC